MQYETIRASRRETMDLEKLRISKFQNICVVNFPKEFKMGIKSTKKHIEVILYYIDRLEDVGKFVKLCASTPLPKENRTIMVYKRGRKDGVNRDSIFMPLRNDRNFTLKAPMLCSISEELSACVMSRVT
jgi:hypothetical protein